MIIGTPEGIVRAYSVHRKALGERWDAERIKAVKGTPQQPNPNVPGLEIPIRIRFDVRPEVGVEEAVPAKAGPDIRRMRITPEMLIKYGYMEGCPACDLRRAGLNEPRSHSERCRQRIMEELEKDEGGKRRLQKEKVRLDRRYAEATEPREEVRTEHGREVEVEADLGMPEQDVGWRSFLM